MCGINLIIDKRNVLGQDPIRKMTDATHHRGPEHRDVLEISSSARIFFGHNRLKINDKNDAANQPFLSPCKRYFLIYNGEIYNFQELRNDLLDQGIIFRTYSDTEVLLYLLITKGISSVSLLEGMFSFVFYDKAKEHVIIARDRNGIKPLFYYDDENVFIASSEIKGILASELVTKSLNEQQIFYFLKYKFANAPETFFKGILNVIPGNYILVDKNNKLISRKFKTKETKNQIGLLQKKDILEKTEALLVDSITKQIHADVNVGVFLSGGVDSTLLLALINTSGLQSAPSFSIVHKKEEKSYGTEDYKYAKKAASLYGSYHYEIKVDIEDLDKFDEFILNLDQPIADSAAFLTYLLSCEAKKKVGVVLSGAGADEVFAGYNRHHAFKWYLENYKLVKTTSPFLEYILPILPTGFEHPFRKKVQLIKKFLRNCSPDPGETFNNFTSLSIIKENIQNETPGFKDPGDIEGNLKAALEFDQKKYLISDVLALTDQMSMKSGLEVRVPYLDQKLMDFISSLPATQIYSGERKWILNSILNKYGGEIFVNREKEGMGLPFGNWVRKAPSNEAIKHINSKSCIIHKYISEASINNLLKDHCNSKADNTLELWALVVLEAWLQKEFG